MKNRLWNFVNYIKHIRNNIRHIEIDNGDSGTLKVAAKSHFKRDYLKAQRSSEQAENDYNNAKTSESEIENTQFLNWFFKYRAKQKVKNAHIRHIKKDQRFNLLNNELNELTEQAKKNPYEQELKLKYPSVDTEEDSLKFKDKLKNKSFRIPLVTVGLVAISLLTGTAPLIPIILAIQTYRFIKTRRALKEFQTLESKKINFENEKNKNPNASEQLLELATSPEREIPLSPRRSTAQVETIKNSTAYNNSM